MGAENLNKSGILSSITRNTHHCASYDVIPDGAKCELSVRPDGQVDAAGTRQKPAGGVVLFQPGSLPHVKRTELSPHTTLPPGLLPRDFNSPGVGRWTLPAELTKQAPCTYQILRHFTFPQRNEC